MISSLDDDAIRVLVARLARPHGSGGLVVERAALLAAGADFEVAVAWIHAQGGRSETLPVRAERGLHGPQARGDAPPVRYILPAGAVTSASNAATRGRETP